jgi:O-antigen ligase
MSRSKTGQIAIIVISAVAIFLPLLRLPGLARIWAIFLAAVGVLAGGTLLIAFFGDIMTAFGKDPTLTGRVPAWAALLDLAGNHLAGGYGYSAFFIEENPDTDYVSAMARWEVIEAHNSYIELLLQLGLPGLLIAIWALLESTIRSFRAWFAGDLPWASFAVAYTVAFSMVNFVETVLFRAGDTHCVMFSLVYVALRINAATRTARASSNLLRSGRPADPLYDVGR